MVDTLFLINIRYTFFEMPEIEVPYDIENEETRASRGTAQYQNEIEILRDSTHLSAPERYLLIRNKIFGKYQEIQKDSPTALVRNIDVTAYPDGKRVGEVYLPKFFKLLDNLEEAVQHLDGKQQSEQGLRLAATCRLLGILVHNAPDGNYQTNELMTLSYIKEFCPEYSESFFPIKYTSEDPEHKKALGSISINMLKTGDSLPLTMDLEDKSLLALSPQIMETVYRPDQDKISLEERTQNIKNYLIDILPQLNDAGLSTDGIKEKIESATFYSNAVVEVTGAIARHINSKYPGHTVLSTGFGSKNEAHMGKAYLELFLNTTQGRDAIREYVLMGQVSPFQSSDTGFDVAKAQEMLNSFVKAAESSNQVITKTLKEETAQVHENKYRNFVSH